MYSFLEAFLVLMKLLSLSQFYAPKFKVQRFQLFQSIKKDDYAPSPTVPHLPLHV